MSDTEFTLTEQHIKLLTSMYVGWQHCEHGAPEIDPKRPYGNGDVVNDIAELLGIEAYRLNEDDSQYDEELYDKLDALHRETETALQVVLATGTFTPGNYTRSEYRADWKLVL